MRGKRAKQLRRIAFKACDPNKSMYLKNTKTGEVFWHRESYRGTYQGLKKGWMER